MGNVLLIAIPLTGAVLPIVVTQFSTDDELRRLGRAVVKYTILFPATLAVVVIGALGFIV